MTSSSKAFSGGLKVRWTPPKPIVKTGFPCQPHRNGQKIADVYACISYTTGLPLYYRVTVGASASDHNFLSFEEAMLFCDINGYWVDTDGWDDPKQGIYKFYSPSEVVRLEDGRVVEIGC